MTVPLLVVSLGALAAGLFIAGWFVIAGERQPRLLATRLSHYAQGGTSPLLAGEAPIAAQPLDEHARRMSMSFSQRVIRPTASRLARAVSRNMGRQRMEELQAQLDAAGGIWGLGPQEYVAAQYGFLAVFALAGVGLGALVGGSTNMLLGGVGLGVVGFLIPRMKLQRAVKARKQEVLEGMPNALDLLTISVEAGLGFDAALLRVAEKYDNALAEEFNQVLTETKLGRPRREALRAMGERVGVDDVSTFTHAVIQSEVMGTPLAGVLRIQSDEMRRKRRQRAEEAGAKAPLKMLLPMVGCIFPTLFIVLLGPAVIEVVHQFSGQP